MSEHRTTDKYFSAPIILKVIYPEGRPIFIWADEDGYVFTDADLELTEGERLAVWAAIEPMVKGKI